MRLRVLLGLVFVVAAVVAMTATVTAGAAALAVLLLLVIVVQRSMVGALGRDLRARLDFVAGVGLLVFAFIVYQRVAEILAK